MLRFLAAHATPGVEAVDLRGYRRSISLNGCHGYFEVSLDEDRDALAARVQIPDPRMLYLIVERIRRMFESECGLGGHHAEPGNGPRVDFTDWRRAGASRTRLLDGFELTSERFSASRSLCRTQTRLRGKS